MKKLLYYIFDYSYIIIKSVFFVYLFLYVFILKEKSIYYTYLMTFIVGILLGYIIADKAHRYLKKIYNEKIAKENEADR
ncbi:MAG: hypothetical protein Q7U47_11795 [Paludibacter sp.]|nr:hypothetical protein [Paludibacter sp.]